MKNPDKRFIETRKKLYQSNPINFDDTCFALFYCPFCGSQKIVIALMPIKDKKQYSEEIISKSREQTLANIFDADYDFLHKKDKCDCSPNSYHGLQRIIYCYNQGEIDCHNYIDYPFEEIKTFKFYLNSDIEQTFFLFFDTETTGLPINWKASFKETYNWPRIVQIAWIVADRVGNILIQNNYVVKPQGFSIPKEATNVHGISTQYAVDFGREIETILNEFNKSLSKANYIVAHNLNFDLNVLASEFFRLNIETELFNKKQICTMESTINFCMLPSKYGYKFPKLSELYQKLFRTNFTEEHDAAFDVKATFECFFELIKKKIINI